MNKLGHLESLFNSSDVVVLADDKDFLSMISKQGLKVQNLCEVEVLPNNSVSISFSDDAARRVFQLAAEKDSARMIFCAAHVFDNTLETAIYSMDLMRRSDYRASLQKQKPVVSLLESSDSVIFTGPKSYGKVKLDRETQPFAFRRDIDSAFVASVAEFFEVHYAHVDRDRPCPFTLNGQLQVNGILSVLRPTGQNPYEGSYMDVKRLITEVANANSVLLTAEDNVITSFNVDGVEHVDFLKIIGGERGVAVTEFAVGVNGNLDGVINYEFNSQVNEGIDGVHIAIGDGVTGYHIDFVCPGVTISQG